MVAVIAGIASKQGRLTSREGVFPRHCGVLARVEAMPHRSTPLLLLLPALPAIALLLAIAAHRASQLRMRTSACSSQTLTGLRTFNPKVVGSSPTGGTNTLVYEQQPSGTASWGRLRRAVLVGGDGCVLLVRLRASFLLVNLGFLLLRC